MNSVALRRILPAVLLLVLVGACGGDHPAAPRINHSPIILSVSALPETLGLSDSTTITCNAVDPDGDPLVYDWFTQLPLRIVGASQGVYLYNTKSNTRVLYYAGPDSLVTLGRVQVFARDTRGLQDGVELYLLLKN